MNLEDELREALRREDAPEGFAERVIGQAGPARAQFRERGVKQRSRWRLQWWTLPAAAAVAATAVMSVAMEYRRAQEQQAREEQAGRQAIMAIQIVAEELNMAQAEVLNK
jgi:hypothetical protein